MAEHFDAFGMVINLNTKLAKALVEASTIMASALVIKQELVLGLLA